MGLTGFDNDWTLEQGSFVKIILFIFGYARSSEKAIATHSSTLAWKIPWTEEPGRLWSMGSHRVRHD